MTEASHYVPRGFPPTPAEVTVSARLTAMDIEQQEFTRKVRGYDPDEVKLFLKSVAEEIERINLENATVREEAVRRLGRALPHLSMGMSDDFEVAVEEGATLVRIGRAIFGDRHQ